MLPGRDELFVTPQDTKLIFIKPEKHRAVCQDLYLKHVQYIMWIQSLICKNNKSQLGVQMSETTNVSNSIVNAVKTKV